MCSFLPRETYDAIMAELPEKKVGQTSVNVHFVCEPIDPKGVERVEDLVRKHAKAIRHHIARCGVFVLSIICVLLCAGSAFAQDSAPQQPLSKKQVFFVNAANVGASVFNARASWYGAHQCVAREELTRNPRGKFIRAAEISLPIDAVVGFASWKLRKRHRMWAMTLPLISAGAQTSMAATQFSAGCF